MAITEMAAVVGSRTQRSLSVGVGRTHTLTCQAAKRSFSRRATNGFRRRGGAGVSGGGCPWPPCRGHNGQMLSGCRRDGPFTVAICE